MKYNPDAYIDYPILRPHSSDYPEGRISTKLSQSHDDTNLHIELSFEIDEPAILKQTHKGDARCCALLYCSSTCYSEMLTAESGTTVIAASVPLNRLRGRVELNPSVITIDDIVMRTDTAHSEYESAPMQVAVHRQLAMDEPWHFAVGSVGPIESVFQLEQTESDTLEDGEYDFQVDPAARYIVIRSNPKTYEAFQIIRERNQTRLTKASVYMIALTSALGKLDEEPEESEPAEGWAATVRALIQELRIQWPDACVDGLAAQKLLRNPLDALPLLSSLVGKGATIQ